MIFLGSVYQKSNEYDLLKASFVGLSNADNILQYNIINGLDYNLEGHVDIINIPNVGSFPKKNKKIFWRTKEWSHKRGANDIEVGILNFPIIKHYIAYRKVLKVLKNRLNRESLPENIIIYSTYLPFLKAVSKLDSSNIKATLVVTDLPEFYHHKQLNKIKKCLLSIYNRYVYKCIECIDNFVLLTENMKVPLEVGNRPYIIVEGMINNNLRSEECTNNVIRDINKKIVMYSGGLHYDYGIRNLLDAFKLVDGDEYELWICGAGEAEKDVTMMANDDSRIKYYGYLEHNKVLELQKRATVLVNPRLPDEEYIKYSFPSKILEYMLSGKPVIMYRLPCIPKDYDDYLIYIEGDQPRDICEALVNLCEKSQEERIVIGKNSRKFVEENKNIIVQTKKIIDLLKY